MINEYLCFDPLAQFEINNWFFFLGGNGVDTTTITGLVLLMDDDDNENIEYNEEDCLDSDMFDRVVNKIVNENLSIKRSHYYLQLEGLFATIIFVNVYGLLPTTWTTTSSFFMAFAVAFIHFFTLNILAVWEKNENYFSGFLPSGVPIFLSPLIVLIEIVSYISRVFSLSIRLFANISSGHALLKILIGFSWGMLNSAVNNTLINASVLILSSCLPWVLVTLIFFLEILIACLQAYVFVILMTIYINDVTASSH